jgi:geranylgeranyl diphosphate synthase type I
VMDGGLTRRHRPSAWSVFGTGRAILAGDMLLTEAVRQLGRLPDAAAAVEVLTGALYELCAGQSQDLAFEQRGDVDLAECLAMAEAKTGALLGAACELGALAAGADRETARCLREFGRQLGLAFQLVDDVLGIWGDPEVTGKPVGSDLASRKKSFPVVAALTSGTRAGRRLARWYGRPGEMDGSGIERVARLVGEAGGGDWATGEAQRRLDTALQALRRTVPDLGALVELEVLAAVMTRREY